MMPPALVLAAGLATRLRPLSLVRAKAALPVAGEPLVRRILRHIAAAGVTDVMLNLHHLPHTLAAVAGDGSDLGLRVRYSWEVPLLGSAGGPRRAVDLGLAPPGGCFLIVNGDTLTNVDLAALVSHHRRSDALVTMAVVENAWPDRYGGLAVNEEEIVTGLVPRGASAPSYHFIGVQAAAPEAFASVPPGTPFESVGALYPALMAARRGSIRAFRTRAEFLDIGTPADYLDTSLRLAGRDGGALTGAGVRLDPSARVDRSILWDDVVVEAGAVLRECVVTDGVRVPAGTSWQGVTLRAIDDELAPGERRVDGLGVASIVR